ncbi:MAG: Phospholipid/glycerol acyltransferase [Proteobacteria bacterium]|nr:Phospholipid/glycerol acyltransferase [Pseudomonadota bacterium]
MTDRRSAGNPFWIAYEYLAMAVGLGSLALICLIWLPCALLLNALLPRRSGRTVGRLMISWGFRLYLRILSLFCACRFDLSEIDRLRDQGPLIVAANHPSLLDAVMIVSRLPNAVCVMKAALMDNLLFGAAARLARYIRNDVALNVILSAREELEDGAHLVIFPEGSRTLNFPFDASSPSVGLIANRSKADVQTLLIEFSTPYLGKAWPLFRRPQLPLTCRVRLGRRFSPPTNIQAFTAELDAYFHFEFGQNFRSTVGLPA